MGFWEYFIIGDFVFLKRNKENFQYIYIGFT